MARDRNLRLTPLRHKVNACRCLCRVSLSESRPNYIKAPPLGVGLAIAPRRVWHMVRSYGLRVMIRFYAACGGMGIGRGAVRRDEAVRAAEHDHGQPPRRACRNQSLSFLVCLRGY